MYISDFLGKGRLSVSFEYFPPKSDVARQQLMESIHRLKSVKPDFVSVTYGAGGSTRYQTLNLCQEIQSDIDGLVMAHLTAVSQTKADISGLAEGFWNAGIVNIMALRGDRPKSGDTSRWDDREFPFAKNLMTHLKSLHPFCLGGACYPEGHSETSSIDIGIDHLKQKIDSGCDFLVTQMFFNNDSYFRFVDRLRARGIDVPVLPGIMPITGSAQIEKFEKQFGATLPDALKDSIRKIEEDERSLEEFGVAWSTEQCRALIDGGVPGIHFYTLNKSSATLRICENLQLAVAGPN
jgi:methylenetetrahydrofolate reductase (NADPH)